MSMSVTMLLRLIMSLLWLKQASTAPSLAKPGCIADCGNISIPYPFGIGKDCYFNDYFSVNCNHSSTPPRPLLNHSKLNNLELLNVSLKYLTATVNSPITPLCENNGTWRSTDFSGSPFRFSSLHNMFMVVGCDTNAVLIAQDQILAGCTSDCNTGITANTSCYGNQCCQNTIRDDFQSTHLGMYGVNYTKTSENCTYAFLGARDWFGNINLSNPAISVDSSYAPLVVFWEMGTNSFGICEAHYLDRQYGITIDVCGCDLKTEGNPFLPHGCQVVEACANCSIEDCAMIGAEFQCLPSHGMAKELKAIILGFSISGGLLLLFVGSFGLYRGVKKRRELIRKQNFFKRNGGLLLQQQLSSNETIEKTKIFTIEELEKATDNFNKSRILGQGGQGTVYKGMLNDGRIVAIKKLKIIAKGQLKQFINEIIILSHINHRNIVGLLGCCLETEVPLLVYEFISNGTLFQLIHDQNGEFPFPWNMRLQIASEAAGAFAYLHSSSSVPIYHRDIKSTNILINEKYKAKVSDFGLSRSIAIDRSHLTTNVQGTFGYFDPEYFRSGHFTEKSDVYSFGVILVELLTGKKPIFRTSPEEEEEGLVACFILSLEEDCLYDILDDQVVKEGEEEKIMKVANIAKQCLNLNGKKRPTMKEVAIELECIRMSSLPITSDQQDIPHGNECGIMETMGENECGIIHTSGSMDSVATSASIASNLS